MNMASRPADGGSAKVGQAAMKSWWWPILPPPLRAANRQLASYLVKTIRSNQIETVVLRLAASMYLEAEAVTILWMQPSLRRAELGESLKKGAMPCSQVGFANPKEFLSILLPWPWCR